MSDNSNNKNSFNGDMLSMEQIESQYVGEWVFIADAVVDESMAVTRGRVLCHSKNREEVDRFDPDCRHQDAAVVFVGPWPEGVDFQL